MSYLTDKYRPDCFDDIVGNQATIRSIQAMLARPFEAIPHTWLLFGPPGCGKTTLGRIILRLIGCRGMDYVEHDSAHLRGVDAMRRIRDNSAYPPIDPENRARGWLFDECHKISKDGKDDLLKLTEEPPPHAFFVFATTNPEELPPMMKSRCVQLEVQPVYEDEMEQFLKEIVQAEKKRVPNSVLKQIAKDSLGGCRDALMILEKVIDLHPDDMMEMAKRTAEKQNTVLELCNALFAMAEWKKIAAILKGLEKESPEQIRQYVLKACSNELLTADNPKAFLVLNTFIQRPFYNNGQAELVNACYSVLNS